MPVSFHSPPLTLGETFGSLRHWQRDSLRCFCLIPLVYLSLVCILRWHLLPCSTALRARGGRVSLFTGLYVPRGWHVHHNANPRLEKDWDPKMCRVGRWKSGTLPSFMAWQSKCSAWPFKTQNAVLNAYGDFFTGIFLSAVTFVALHMSHYSKKSV